jgi:hypothetical protein
VGSVANEMGACLTLRQRNQELDRHRDRGAEANLMPQLAFACGVVGRHDMMSQLLGTGLLFSGTMALCFFCVTGIERGDAESGVAEGNLFCLDHLEACCKIKVLSFPALAPRLGHSAAVASSRDVAGHRRPCKLPAAGQDVSKLHGEQTPRRALLEVRPLSKLCVGQASRLCSLAACRPAIFSQTWQHKRCTHVACPLRPCRDMSDPDACQTMPVRCWARRLFDCI